MIAFRMNQTIPSSVTRGFLSSGQTWAVLAVLHLCLWLLGPAQESSWHRGISEHVAGLLSGTFLLTSARDGQESPTLRFLLKTFLTRFLGQDQKKMSFEDIWVWCQRLTSAFQLSEFPFTEQLLSVLNFAASQVRRLLLALELDVLDDWLCQNDFVMVYFISSPFETESWEYSMYLQGSLTSFWSFSSPQDWC